MNEYVIILQECGLICLQKVVHECTPNRLDSVVVVDDSMFNVPPIRLWFLGALCLVLVFLCIT